jgi:hypothetical protein
MAYSKKLNLVFVHIPKCAGTSIIEAMRSVDPSVEHGHNKWYYYTAYSIVSKDPMSFTIVRNPWDRVYSCYRYAIQKESYWHGENKRWGIHPDYNILKNYNFKDAVKILYNNKHLLDLPEHSRSNFKHNWSYQHPFFTDEKTHKTIKQILRYENMSDICGWLLDAYGLEVPVLNVSHSEDYKTHYDDETIDLVSQIYAKDISILKYKF